MTNIHH